MNIKQILLGVGTVIAFGLMINSLSSQSKTNILNSPLLGEFNRFKNKFNKVYNSDQEHAYRMAVFAKNLEDIISHNSRNDVTYILGVNQFSDMTFEEFKSKYLMQSIPSSITKDCDVKESSLSNDIPKTVDWFAAGKVQQVKDQKRCGSCWAFAAIGSVESAIAISGAALPNLSEQELVDCSTDYDNGGCNGGLPSLGLAYIIDNKISSETDYPYKGVDQKCNVKAQTKSAIKTCYRLPRGVDHVTNAVVTQPIAVGFYVREDFVHYKSGVYNPTNCNEEPNHGVLVVGYDLTDPTPFFSVKNSWGPSWGDKGFFKIAIGSGDGVCSLGAHEENAYPVV